MPSLVHAQPCSQPIKTKFYCRPVIVGDEKGKLLEVLLDEKEKRDPLVKTLYSFEDAPEKITGLEQHLAQQRTLVLVATITRLYVFVGDRDLEPLFASYPESAGQHFCQTSLPITARCLTKHWGLLGHRLHSRVSQWSHAVWTWSKQKGRQAALQSLAHVVHEHRAHKEGCMSCS